MGGQSQQQNSNQKQKARSSSDTTSQLSPYKPLQGQIGNLGENADDAFSMGSAYLPDSMTQIGNAQEGLFAGGGFGTGSENIGMMPGLLSQGTQFLNNAGDQYGDRLSGHDNRQTRGPREGGIRTHGTVTRTRVFEF